MSDTPYSAPRPPKTITKIKSDQFLDFKSMYTWILLFTVSIVLILINQIVIQRGPVQGFFLAVLFFVVVGWLKYCSTSDKVDALEIRFKFFIGDQRGEHVINAYTKPIDYLEKIVPIVEIHKMGIVEFKNNKYGLLIETNPTRISDEEREDHERRMEKVLNGIPSNIHFKTMACSRLEPRKPIMHYLLDVANTSNMERAADMHITGMYSKIAEDSSPVISWKYYVFLSLGEQRNLEAANIQYGATVPGLLKNMKVARLQPIIYEDPHEIANAYRTMFSEMTI